LTLATYSSAARHPPRAPEAAHCAFPPPQPGADGATTFRISGCDGARPDRLAALHDLVASLGDTDLSLTVLAARHRCTPRYVQRLFDDAGETFTDYVLSQRLARAHRMLSNPLRAGEKIASVAYDVGFNDLSHFNRAFRRRYGETQSEVRSGTRGATAEPRAVRD
jgi:AraC-like DNA-binding protein